MSDFDVRDRYQLLFDDEPEMGLRAADILRDGRRAVLRRRGGWSAVGTSGLAVVIAAVTLLPGGGSAEPDRLSPGATPAASQTASASPRGLESQLAKALPSALKVIGRSSSELANPNDKPTALAALTVEDADGKATVGVRLVHGAESAHPAECTGGCRVVDDPSGQDLRVLVEEGPLEGVGLSNVDMLTVIVDRGPSGRVVLSTHGAFRGPDGKLVSGRGSLPLSLDASIAIATSFADQL